MNIKWRQELPHLLLLASLFVVAGVLWSRVPDRIPVHWNLAGEADRHGGKIEGLLLIPLLTFGLYWLLLFIPRIDPRRDNFAKFETAYRAIRWMLTIFMAAIYAMILGTALGYPIDMTRAVCLLMGGLFAGLGLCLAHLEQNCFAGIRTPWTMSSSLSWQKTHQASQWVFLSIASAFLLLGIVKSPWVFLGLLVVAVGGIGGLILYSYLVWKSDPVRQGESRPGI